MSAAGISSSSSTSTTVDPPQDAPAPVGVSSSLSVTDSKNVENRWETISTLSPLLREAFGSELKMYKGIYSLVGLPQPEVWQKLRTCLAGVTAFDVNQDTKADGISLSPAVLLNVQMELGKLPFFPNLQALRIYSINPLIYFSPLFISPSLKAVATGRWNKRTKGKKKNSEAYENFLQVLPLRASGLESLIIDHPDKVFKSTSGVFKNISRFQSVRTLHFQCPVTFGGISDIKSLSMLPHLEELQLAVSWWGWIETAPVQKANVSISLDTLQRLILSAPPRIFLEVIRAIEVKQLDCIIGECPSKSLWEWWDIGAGEIWEVMTEKWSDARMALATVLSSEKVDYSSFVDAFAPMLKSTLDLKSILLESSQVKLIFFADPSVNVTLADLRDIADKLPALASLSLVVDTSNVPSCCFRPLQHKLEQLMVYGADPVEKDKLFDIARYLHCLFPSLQGVQTKGELKVWKEISKLVQFSYQIAADERRRVTRLSMGRD